MIEESKKDDRREESKKMIEESKKDGRRK